ncbi:hypothetical protein [Pedobacter chitinilyticus]|uniref:hypothetical protein n=1 Tax=Pedobacter chitinilyticus TaxID=2233776 RepID=UPI00196961F9|nr:hypothetical protein [Pedobacter chitinilyticus]
MYKTILKKLAISLFFSLCFLTAFSQNKKVNVILLGTYHFNHPGKEYPYGR